MNVVSKATSRKRGMARKARAAQKPSQTVTEVVPDAPSDNLDSLGLPELRQLARAKGWSSATRLGKVELRKLLRENPDGPPAISQSPMAKHTKSKVDSESEAPKYVDRKTAEGIGARLVEVRKQFGRARLAEIVGLTPSELWRCEAPQSRPKPAELEKIQAALARIDSGELVPPEKKIFGRPASEVGGPSKRDLQNALEEVRSVLSDVPVTGLKIGQARAALTQCLDIIDKVKK